MSQNNSVDVTEYLLDIQPSLAVVLKSKIGLQNTHYVHGLRGVQSQVANSAWTEAMSDGLGSVRGWLNGSQMFVSDVNYNPYGVPDASVDGFGFTGEMTDANGLVYLRARYYNPNIGVFASLDPFEGKTCTPMSVNGYSWVEGNVANWTDPTGKIYKWQIGQIVATFNIPRMQYSCNCGWLDWEHINPIHPLNLISTIAHAMDSNLYSSPNSHGMVFQTTYGASSGQWMKSFNILPWFYIKRNGTASLEDLAFTAFGQIVSILESFESRNAFTGLITGFSGFNVEDVPSYFIGFLVALSTYYRDEGIAYYNNSLPRDFFIPIIRQECDTVSDEIVVNEEIFDIEPVLYRGSNQSILPPDRSSSLDHYCGSERGITRLPSWFTAGAQVMLNSYNKVGDLVRGEGNNGCHKRVLTGYPNNIDGPIELYECDDSPMSNIPNLPISYC